MKRQGPIQENAAALRLDYIQAAAWYWLRAEGPDESLVSALQRTRAQGLRQRFEMLRMELPADQEVYAYAQERWPEHKLHSL